MSKPQSIKTDPWVGLPKQPYSIIDDDFCHDKNFVTKLAFKNQKTTINVKETVNSKKGDWSAADEVKFWFDLPCNKSIYAKVKANYMKLHFDNGIKEWSNRKWNFYASVNSNKNLKNLVLKFGVGQKTETTQKDNRLKVVVGDQQNQYYMYSKVYYAKDKWRFGFLSVFDIGRNIWQKRNILLGYNHNTQHSGYLRLQTDGFKSKSPNPKNFSTYFDSLVVDYVNNLDDKSKAAIEAKYDIKNSQLANVQAIYQRKQKDTTWKIGVNHRLDAKIFMKRPFYKLQNIASLSTGVGISGLLRNEVSFKTGFQVDINL